MCKFVLILCVIEICGIVAITIDTSLYKLMNQEELNFYLGLNGKAAAQNLEVVDISTDDLKFKFDGEEISLKLKINSQLTSPGIKIVKKTKNSTINLNNYLFESCQFLHSGSDETVISASIKICKNDQLEGLIFLPNKTLEIQPLNDRLKAIYFKSFQNPHVIKKLEIADIGPVSNEIKNRYVAYGRKLTIELGLFFDEAAYRTFAPYFNYDDEKLIDFILAYMNGIQALYHHPSLGTPIDVTLVYIEIMQDQPKNLPHFQGDRDPLIDSFCAYQKIENPEGESHPNHWDMALYLSGLDFYAYENGRKSSATMGLATVGGVCLSDYACVISEFGSKNVFGKPYPSAGFTSIYIAAHEMGHNLGMYHDSSKNNCPSDGFIMSPSRGTQGETIWSRCSADIVKNLNWAECLFDAPAKTPKELDTSKFREVPGEKWTIKKQCEILLVDKDAFSAPTTGLEGICQNLQCRTPNRVGFYFSGPALEGSDCGNGKICYGGSCTKPKNKPQTIIVGGWGDWKHGKCRSGCIEDSLGYQRRSRVCNNPKPVNSNEGCQGNAYDVVTCDDKKICGKIRQNINHYASEKCKEFSKVLPKLDPKGVGLQSAHDPIRLWMGCSIFCKTNGSSAFYSPRFELNDRGIDAYFADGTLCHVEGNEKYYCLQKHCLPENFKTTKTALWTLGEDIPVPSNALPPTFNYLEEKILGYLSLDENKKAINPRWHFASDNFKNKIIKFDDQWYDPKDYRELPDGVLRYRTNN